MTSIITRLTNLPEKWLRHGAKLTTMLRDLCHYTIALFSIVTSCFALSLVSVAIYFRDNPEQPYLPPHELLLQAWDNALALTLNIGVAYFAITYAAIGIKHLLNKKTPLLRKAAASLEHYNYL